MNYKDEKSTIMLVLAIILFISGIALGENIGMSQKTKQIENLVNNTVIVRSSDRYGDKYKVVICNLDNTCLELIRNKPAKPMQLYTVN